MIDLFSGAGGMSYGFKAAGYKAVLAVEMDKAAADSYRANFPGVEVVNASVEDVPDRCFPPADVIIGGPPCQGFSTLGKMTPRPGHKALTKLWEHFLRVVSSSRPAAFVIENVPQMLKSEEFLRLEEQANELGYSVDARVLNAYEYGVPQLRKRAFIIGFLGEASVPLFPEPTSERNNVRQAFKGLDLEPTGENWHVGRNPTDVSLERYKCIPPGGNRFDLINRRPDITPRCWIKKKTGSTDVFGRLEWSKPSLTIRTEFYKPEKGRYLHPESDRPITHREAARLQSFDDHFIFKGSKTQVARQIGNAVPPKLAYALALQLITVLKSTGYSPSVEVYPELEVAW